MARSQPHSISLTPALDVDIQAHALERTRAATKEGGKRADVKDVVRDACALYMAHVRECPQCLLGIRCLRVEDAAERYGATPQEGGVKWKAAREAYLRAWAAVHKTPAPFGGPERAGLLALFESQGGQVAVIELIRRAWSHPYWGTRITLRTLANNPALVMTSGERPEKKTARQAGSFEPGEER